MHTTKTLEDLLLSEGIVTEEMRTKLCIIEDLVKFTTSKNVTPPTDEEIKKLMNIPLAKLEEIRNDMDKWWNAYLEFKEELRSVVKLMELLTLMRRGK